MILEFVEENSILGSILDLHRLNQIAHWKPFHRNIEQIIKRVENSRKFLSRKKFEICFHAYLFELTILSLGKVSIFSIHFQIKEKSSIILGRFALPPPYSLHLDHFLRFVIKLPLRICVSRCSTRFP